MIDLLFENDDLLAADKPDGLASIPGGGADKDCLLTRLEAQLGQKLYVVHRLDKEVSGVILFAKHAAAHKQLNRQFEQRQVTKIYRAVAHGLIREAGGLINQPIRQFGSGRMGVDARRGKASQTSFTVLERFAAATLVEAQPLTGRRHQLRVHFYHLGHPLIGDRRYGDRAAQQRYARLLLHAQWLTVRLPSGEPVSIESPLPDLFVEMVEKMRRNLDPFNLPT